MEQVLLVIHLLVAIALVAVVLVQRSEGGGLGMGGGGLGPMLSVRGTANLLTRTTAILAACFMATSVLLAILAGGHQPRADRGIVRDEPAATQPVLPPVPSGPQVPVTTE